MATLHYTTLDVFTTVAFQGNPLAIIYLPSQLSQQQRLLIAREFNFSETIFVHDQELDSRAVLTISIFTPSQGLPFAGHLTVGAGCYLLSKTSKDKITLRMKAGDVLVSGEETGVRLKVPVDFKVHAPYLNDILKGKQPAWKKRTTLTA